ncbi:uncharacterized protein LOC123675676 [Harmonia axyridis]|uniref:uncharacterized protein LOC123675676 n=1 Tax=Harmonia axyridis TaxID=115357 RepID=UPI001E277FB1|nr:uncharacterized protein LOC123675676 [Harmonia axyridis]
MKVFIVLIACLVASAYSRQVIVRYVDPEAIRIHPEVIRIQRPLIDPVPPKRSFLGEAFNQVGELAADTVDTAGRIAQGIVEVPATLVSKTVEEAGKGAAKALRETGNVAARAVEHVEHGIDNMFSGWD